MHRHGSYLFLLLTLPFFVGCEGCRPAPTTPDDEERASKEAFTTEAARVYPVDQSSISGSAKPGHWMTAEQSIRSNKVDSRGEMSTRATVAVKNLELEITGSIESRETIRPVVLPKGQMRRLDFRFRCPVPNTIETRHMTLFSRFVPRSGGILEKVGGDRVRLMPASEYFFVVLTTRPEKFTRMQVANWASTAESQWDSASKVSNYQVVVPKSGQLLPLPETMLDMTSIGVVLWDDISEDALTPAQQGALADWVRFGGRLIINGAEASESVANTAIGDLLALTPTSNIELSSDAAVELLKNWSVPEDPSVEKQIEFVISESSRIAVDGQLMSGAEPIKNTGNLVLTKRVGRGNVIQPRFDLTDDWIEAWNSYDSFINGAILGRPPREYAKGRDYDPSIGDVPPLYFTGTKIRADAAVNTQFRLLARDAILGADDESVRQSGSKFDRFHRVDGMTGVASWNDRSDTIGLMKQKLTEEAGIEIPGSDLVIRSLAIYLIVLVPINYLVFRLMNRLEYAWFAVPVIALIGAAWAARQAQLDIGFARSQSELALLEVHAGYPRAHLTRMIGIYNSLSSRYELQFQTVDGVASRLDDEPDPGTNIQPVFKNSFEEGPSLADFAVPSNRMRYVHTEEMVDLGGNITIDETGRLLNESSLDLMDAVVVRRNDSSQLEFAVVGDLESGSSATTEFRESVRAPFPSGLPMQADRLLDRYAAVDAVPPGSTRLVARIDASLDGLEVTPQASQSISQTIAVVHLQHAPPIQSGIDKNLIPIRVNRAEDVDSEDSEGEFADSSGES